MPNSGPRYLDVPARGAGRPRGVLVLLHAFPLSERMWEPQLALAADGWRILAPDLMSDAAAAPAVDDYAGTVIDLLDHLHVTEAVVCGMSMGGYVALALFRLATRYIQGLILADTRAEPDSPEAIAARKAMQTTAKEKGAEAIAADMIPKLLGETTRATRPDVVERVRSLILERSAGSIAGALNVMMTRPDSTTLLSSIHVPTLVLVGEEDVVTPRGFAETLSRGIAGSELVSIAGAGHLSSLEQPEAFNAAVARFLSHRV